jgi:hypothetical protein
MQLVRVNTVHAQDAAFFDLNFDDQVAGMNCNSPKRNWGTQGEDLVLIDNVDTYSGEGNCMLFERPEGAKPNGWGVGVNLPQKPYDWLSVQLAFKFEGTATQANASIELREVYNKRCYVLSLGSGRGKDPLVLVNERSGWKSTGVNHFDRKVWNRVTWYIPSVTADAQEMLVKLEAWDAGEKTWKAVGKIGTAAADKMEKAFATLRINFPGKAPAIKLRFDDLKISPMTNEQISTLHH